MSEDSSITGKKLNPGNTDLTLSYDFPWGSVLVLSAQPETNIKRDYERTKHGRVGQVRRPERFF